MSLLPSSSAVSERLIVLRQERLLARAAFRAAVEAASVEWEAELLLALEEVRDAGGFARVQERIREGIERERRAAASPHCRMAHGAPTRIPCDDARNTRLCELFLADRLDLEAALLSVSSDATLFLKGDPTMATERAALRIRLLTGVYTEMREAILADLEAQETRDRALIEERDRATREEQEARQRLLLLGAQHRLPRGVVTPHSSIGF